jgi:O-methyltransferase
MPASSRISFATPKENVSLDDCFFYHTMDLPGIGTVGEEWDLRASVDAYLGNTDFAGKRVLEIGPASGFLTVTMEKKGASVVCLEVTEEKAWEFVPYPESFMKSNRADRRTGIPRLQNSFWLTRKLHGSSSKVYYGDANSIPDALGRFDIALLAAVLLHCQSPTRIIEQCAKRSNCIIIAERLFPELEGKPVCRLVPDVDNKAWDTWWDFSTEFFIQYLRVLGFTDIRMNPHVQLFKGKYPLKMFTIVASRPDAQIVGATGADAVEVAAAAEPDSAKASQQQEAERFVRALYRGVLRREPDSGAAYHINAVLDGRSPAAVIEDFMNSDEFKNLNAAK